jgi:Holliday junction DNA helicase RuvA
VERVGRSGDRFGAGAGPRLRLDAAVVEVGGVGLLVQATPATLAELRTGAEAELATSLVVREDALTLFGFADADERDVFEIVQTVSGIGPRLALAMLAVHTPTGCGPRSPAATSPPS